MSKKLAEPYNYFNERIELKRDFANFRGFLASKSDDEPSINGIWCSWQLLTDNRS